VSKRCLTLRLLPESEIEQALLAHPDVAEAALISEKGHEGQQFQVAYVAVAAERLEAGTSRTYAAERDRRIAQWRRTFDHVYRRGADDFAPSFVGWTSNFTNQPISEGEMAEWLDCTVERIRGFGAERILEVGCGVGLLLERLAPGSVVYRGTDLSPVAVHRLRAFTAQRPALHHVELLEREAVDFSGMAAHSIDAVIINSVVQYFPGIEYLHDVLEQAVRVVAPGGRIFIGDVRHFGLLRTFHSAVQFAKAPRTASAKWLRRRIALSIEQERELVIDPEFFRGLSGSIPRITGAEVLLKRGSDNELTRYRYDAVLHVDGATSSASDRLRQLDGASTSHATLLACLAQRSAPCVSLRHIPNSRLVHDAALAASLADLDDRTSLADIGQPVKRAPTAMDPESFWQLGESTGYDVSINCSAGESNSFDVTFIAHGHGHPAPSPPSGANQFPGGRPLATRPMAAAFLQQLGLELGSSLQAQFPDASLPAAVIALDQRAFAEFTQAPGLQPQMNERAGRARIEG
jgi:SAM-dependent methyltransferase